jgi:hypothetical protein
LGDPVKSLFEEAPAAFQLGGRGNMLLQKTDDDLVHRFPL